MRVESPLTSNEPNQNLLHTAFFIEQISLVLVVQVVLINLLSRVFAPIHHLLPAALLQMRATSAVAALLATLALFFTESSRSRRLRYAGEILAALTSLTAAITLWASVSPAFLLASHVFNRGVISGQSHFSFATIAFLLLGIVILFLRAHDSMRSHTADIVASCLALLLLILLSESLFAFAGIPGSSTDGLPSISSLVCLALLTLVVILRRAEHGLFSVFLGDSIGGRIARILAPFLLALPVLRELGRARFLDAQLLPSRYATAILTSIATAISFGLLLLVSRQINKMQSEIHDLSLRDELTGLYNFRGFNLFADQAFRLAQRARLPFGILFADMDNLKAINDELGHSAGSTSLVETARLLTANFRETDVIGRLGGDEFVVAGQFDEQEITAAIERLRLAATSKTQIAGNALHLSLSLGYAATKHSSNETLKSMLAQADKAMYKEKRAKKRMALA